MSVTVRTPIPIYYISRDHEKAHELTNHILPSGILTPPTRTTISEYIPVYGGMCQYIFHILVYTSTSISQKHIFEHTVHGIGVSWFWNILKQCPCIKMWRSQVTVYTCIYHIWNPQPFHITVHTSIYSDGSCTYHATWYHDLSLYIPVYVGIY